MYSYAPQKLRFHKNYQIQTHSVFFENDLLRETRKMSYCTSLYSKINFFIQRQPLTAWGGRKPESKNSEIFWGGYLGHRSTVVENGRLNSNFLFWGDTLQHKSKSNALTTQPSHLTCCSKYIKLAKPPSINDTNQGVLSQMVTGTEQSRHIYPYKHLCMQISLCDQTDLGLQASYTSKVINPKLAINYFLSV